MRDAEDAAIARGIDAGRLMEDAGASIAQVLRQFQPEPASAVLYLGKGNNAGDALVAARHLLAAGWSVYARLSGEVAEFKPLPAALWQKLGDRIRNLSEAADVERLRGRVVLIDGIVGIGAFGPLRDSLAGLVREMNALKRTRHAFVVALDLPSGLSSANGEPLDPCVEADVTITVAHVKDALLQDTATPFVGRLAVAPVAELEHAAGDDAQVVLTPGVLLPMLRSRSFDTHKGQAGRVALIAGSKGYLGAAELCARAALHGGAGLVTLYVKEDIYPLVAVRTPAEVMVKAVRDYREALRDQADVVAVGPGLGVSAEEEVLAIVARAEVPVVMDADALNMLGRRGFDSLDKSRAPRLLTPHPGEMARLTARAPSWQGLSRAQTVAAFIKDYPQVTLLLKGARTVIGASGMPLAYNTTGHPGMATGGMGDVLTGLCAALIAGGLNTFEAACLGSWLNGKAAESAIIAGHASGESLSAGVALAHLGCAFDSLRSFCF